MEARPGSKHTAPEGTGPTKAVAGCSSKLDTVKRAGPTSMALDITPVVGC